MTLSAAIGLAPQGNAQATAPQSLPPCLIQYGYSTFSSYAFWSLVLYNADQTYVEINSYFINGPKSGTYATSSGTYTYTLDPGDSTHATISYLPPRSNGTAADQLYFLTAATGFETPLASLLTTEPAEEFRVYSKQVSDGAANVSNRCQLAAGGAAISGFVIESGGPRLVLIRAVGASLENFGVTATASSPSFSVYDSTQFLWGASTKWSSDPNLLNGYNTIFAVAGAFPLNSGSDEGVLLIPLNPGAYTAVFQAGTAGAILCEVYILPFESMGKVSWIYGI